MVMLSLSLDRFLNLFLDLSAGRFRVVPCLFRDCFAVFSVTRFRIAFSSLS